MIPYCNNPKRPHAILRPTEVKLFDTFLEGIGRQINQYVKGEKAERLIKEATKGYTCQSCSKKLGIQLSRIRITYEPSIFERLALWIKNKIKWVKEMLQ